MKQILTILTAMLLTCYSSDSEVKAQETQTPEIGKVLVAYFSFTSNTKAYAEKIAEMTGGDLYEIVPEVAYGSENSNYYDQSTRAYKEQYNTGGEQRPAIKETLENASQYAVVFLGSPIWYGKSPRVILTFLDKYGFQGKTVIPFVTSASTGISKVNEELPSTYPNINWKEGRRLNGVSDADLRTWVQSFVGSTTQKMYLTIGGVTKTATLVSNSSTEALVAQLQQGNITYEAHDYGNFEKVGPLGYMFPENNEQITTVPGDLILYQGSNLCIYYDENSWNFTRIGKLDNMSQDEIKTWANAGGDNVSVTLSLTKPSDTDNLNALFSRESFSLGTTTMPYRKAEISHNTSTRPSLVLYLHGGTARGDENEKQLNEAAVAVIFKYLQSHGIPATMLVPQCPAGGGWTGQLRRVVNELLRAYIADGKADANRIYVMGGSMGGTGTWCQLSYYPNFYAAAMPVAGNPTGMNAENVATTPVLTVMGTADNMMSIPDVETFQTSVVEAGGYLRLDIEQGWSHPTTCEQSYTEERLDWLFSNVRSDESGIHTQQVLGDTNTPAYTISGTTALPGYKGIIIQKGNKRIIK